MPAVLENVILNAYESTVLKAGDLHAPSALTGGRTTWQPRRCRRATCSRPRSTGWPRASSRVCLPAAWSAVTRHRRLHHGNGRQRGLPQLRRAGAASSPLMPIITRLQIFKDLAYQYRAAIPAAELPGLVATAACRAHAPQTRSRSGRTAGGAATATRSMPRTTMPRS